MVDGGGITVWAMALGKLSRRRVDLIFMDSGSYVAKVSGYLDLRTFEGFVNFVTTARCEEHLHFWQRTVRVTLLALLACCLFALLVLTNTSVGSRDEQVQLAWPHGSAD
jgi:CRISPR/Cas system-associated endonuclease Cas1